MAVAESPRADTAAAMVSHGGCPFHHSGAPDQKTARDSYEGPAIERDAEGVWRVRSYHAARQILKSDDTKQAGFRAELLASMPSKMKPPVLYQEGQTHHEQRRKTARFFTPRAVSANYRELMESLADSMVAELKRKRRVDLSKLTMTLAVQVAGKVVGLTDSVLPGMDRRIDAFFAQDIERPGWNLRSIRGTLRNQWSVSLFFLLDVKPAIRARRKEPREDVISHLISQDYTDAEILTECVTYGAAGMATTREFISIAAWHMLEQPELRALSRGGGGGAARDSTGDPATRAGRRSSAAPRHARYHRGAGRGRGHDPTG